MLSSAAALSLAGCSIFVPYDSEFSCPGTTDYGKCLSVEGAYSEALGGAVEADAVASEDVAGDKAKSKEKPKSRVAGESQALGRAAVNRYKAAEYAELAKAIESPITPMVLPPKVLRTLVIAYATGEKTLYMPRYVYFFANDGAFVLGDYLSREKAEGDRTFYPNGVER